VFDCKIGKLTSAAQNEEKAKGLWTQSEELTGIRI
jgi:hypothetical protein